MNKLILGDNLDSLKKLESESVDLIYLDPPFFSNRSYEVIWGDKGEIRSFEDRWSGGMDHYISWLKDRVEQMHRVLKPTGSIFLHCDYHANAHIRVFILDKIFGYENFQAEIIWQRTNAHNDARKKMGVLTDTIWYYSKSTKFTYSKVYEAYKKEYLESSYKYQDEKGRFGIHDLTNPSKVNKNGLYEYKGYKPPVNGWRCPIETMQKWDSEGLIWFPENKSGRLRFKRYLDESKGSVVGNIWTDITNVQSQSKERIGYPTQKPEALLERIIKMASNENDVVLDPFVGGGTTVSVANKLNRKWIGIDQSPMAIKVSELRLERNKNLFSEPFIVQLHKYDFDFLRNSDAFQFESFIVEQFGGIPNVKQRGDSGIDGKTRDGLAIQVKRSDNIGRNVVDNFLSAINRFDKKLFETQKTNKSEVGYIIAFSFGKGAIGEVARLKHEENINIKLVRVDEIVPMATKPKLNLIISEKNIGEIDSKGNQEFILKAKAESESGIEFFAWDFNYDENLGFQAEIMIDKTGEQNYKFGIGEHKIAVKAIDNDGLESIEIVKLKINGKIEIISTSK